MKKTVLCFLIDRTQNKLLMILKKRGQGIGKWNVPGGKIQGTESDRDAVIRETQEETGLTIAEPREVGQLHFFFKGGNSWDNHCTVFTSEIFSGELVPENEECSCQWVSLDKIPYQKMWESDRQWAPLVFSGQYFHRAYTFDEQDRVVEEKILPLPGK